MTSVLPSAHGLGGETLPIRKAARVRSIQRSWSRLRTWFVCFGDMCGAVVAGSLGQSIRFGSQPLLPTVTTAGGPATVTYTQVSLGFVIAWIGALVLSGAYLRRNRLGLWEQSGAVLRAAVGSLAAVGVLSLSLQLQLSRSYVATTLACVVVASVMVRIAVLTLFSQLGRFGIGVERLVVVGDDNPSTVALRTQLNTTAARRTRFVGDVRADGKDLNTTVAEVEAVVARNGATTVVVSGGDVMPVGLARSISARLSGTGVSVVVAPGTAEAIGPGVQLFAVGDLFLLRVRDSKPGLADRIFKACIDRFIALVFLVLAAPLIGAVAVMIRRESPGPVLFRQQRVGRNGAAFDILKFRTMVADAEATLKRDGLWDAYVECGFKLPAGKDPRVTRVGEKLRKTSLDELPQLVNVLRGTMSLVGPRPVVPDELACYGPLVGAYTGVLPGITGYWQVNGRSDVGFPERAELDAYYYDNRSLRVDLRILLRTVSAVLQRVGAH